MKRSFKKIIFSLISFMMIFVLYLIISPTYEYREAHIEDINSFYAHIEMTPSSLSRRELIEEINNVLSLYRY